MSDFSKSRISGHDNWSTPQEFYDILNAEFHFDDDPCPLYGEVDADGLLREWGKVAFMNPPYSDPGPWCQKAVLEAAKGKTVVGLLRGDSSTRWFHRFVLPFADELGFVSKRLKFGDKKGAAPFASFVVVWRGAEKQDPDRMIRIRVW